MTIFRSGNVVEQKYDDTFCTVKHLSNSSQLHSTTWLPAIQLEWPWLYLYSIRSAVASRCFMLKPTIRRSWWASTWTGGSHPPWPIWDEREEKKERRQKTHYKRQPDNQLENWTKKAQWLKLEQKPHMCEEYTNWEIYLWPQLKNKLNTANV